MGYYTRYHLGWDSEDDLGFFARRDEIMDYIEEHGPVEMRGALVGESWKWYEFRDDMLELSKRFPETMFQLEGYGQGDEDIWVTWFKDGKYHLEYAKMIWPEFGPEKLKETL